jgi:large conductance mechanosensitive channel
MPKQTKKERKSVKERQKSFWGEFKTFITKGNVINLAVGVVLGAAFQAIVNSLVSDVVMPFVGMFTKGVDFGKLYVDLTEMFAKVPVVDILVGTSGEPIFPEPIINSLESARAANHVVLAYGSLLTAVLNFIVIGLVIFLLIRNINRMSERLSRKKKKTEAAPAPLARKCPYCCTEIPNEATRCPHCTSDLPVQEDEENSEEPQEL